MPFKSKLQLRKFAVLVEQGKMKPKPKTVACFLKVSKRLYLPSKHKGPKSLPSPSM